MDALESTSQLQTKKKAASTMLFKFAHFHAIFANDVKWAKKLDTQVYFINVWRKEY